MYKHLTPKPIVITDRYKFHKCTHEGQSVREFFAKLQKLAEMCEFCAYRDNASRDRLVCGINSKAIRRKLLVEDDLSLKKAVDIAARMELTNKGINQFSNDNQVNKIASDVVNEITTMRSIFTKVQNVVYVCKRDILARNAQIKSLPSMKSLYANQNFIPRVMTEVSRKRGFIREGILEFSSRRTAQIQRFQSGA